MCVYTERHISEKFVENPVVIHGLYVTSGKSNMSFIERMKDLSSIAFVISLFVSVY